MEKLQIMNPLAQIFIIRPLDLLFSERDLPHSLFVAHTWHIRE